MKGGLIVLILFLRQLPVNEVVEMFDGLARQLFPQSSQAIGGLKRLYHLFRSWYRDGLYEAKTLEYHLTQNLGQDALFSNSTRSLIASKVGVTAATLGKADPVILTTYNGPFEANKKHHYKNIHPKDYPTIPVWLA